MNDVHIFANNENQLETFHQTIRIFGLDIKIE